MPIESACRAHLSFRAVCVSKTFAYLALMNRRVVVLKGARVLPKPKSLLPARRRKREDPRKRDFGGLFCFRSVGRTLITRFDGADWKKVVSTFSTVGGRSSVLRASVLHARRRPRRDVRAGRRRPVTFLLVPSPSSSLVKTADRVTSSSPRRDGIWISPKTLSPSVSGARGLAYVHTRARGLYRL